MQKLSKPLFTSKQIEGLLTAMKTFYMDGELLSDDGKYALVIDITKDKAGKDGWIFTWELGKFEVDEDGEEGINWIMGEKVYSTDDLFESLAKHGII
jgi:hypothetical protein